MIDHHSNWGEAAQPDFDIAEPQAAALVESLRAFGYDLGTAIADLIDNSVSAGASNVWVDFNWRGADSTIAITDDGKGMSENDLRDAMRLGSRNPRETRASSDLGRFGLGMKTASFSQCRCVTVRTRQSNAPMVTRRWDLEHLARTDQWQLLTHARVDAAQPLIRFDGLACGTVVLWQSLDRITGNLQVENEKHRDVFLSRCELVEQHLSLVFHRLLERRNRLKLFINGRAIRPADPFFEVEATQILEPRSKATPAGEILVEPFVMPHESKLFDAEARRLAGDPKDWSERQGFYIYRNDRLLVAGTWLGFREWRKDDLHKLARIRISLTNTSDEDWQIDVTKSKARPPDYLRDWLRSIGEVTRAKAKRVYTFRGERLVTTKCGNINHVWDQIARHGTTSYQINREHPVMARLLRSEEMRPALESALRLIEETIPIPLIAYSSRENAEPSPPLSHEGDFPAVRLGLIEAFHGLTGKGLSAAEALHALSLWEPFNRHPQLIQELRDQPPSLP